MMLVKMSQKVWMVTDTCKYRFFNKFRQIIFFSNDIFFDRMCGPKTNKTILDHRPFGFPFDRKNDFDIYEEE